MGLLDFIKGTKGPAQNPQQNQQVNSSPLKPIQQTITTPTNFNGNFKPAANASSSAATAQMSKTPEFSNQTLYGYNAPQSQPTAAVAPEATEGYSPQSYSVNADAAENSSEPAADITASTLMRGEPQSNELLDEYNNLGSVNQQAVSSLQPAANIQPQTDFPDPLGGVIPKAQEIPSPESKPEEPQNVMGMSNVPNLNLDLMKPAPLENQQSVGSVQPEMPATETVSETQPADSSLQQIQPNIDQPKINTNIEQSTTINDQGLQPVSSLLTKLQDAQNTYLTQQQATELPAPVETQPLQSAEEMNKPIEAETVDKNVNEEIVQPVSQEVMSTKPKTKDHFRKIALVGLSGPRVDTALGNYVRDIVKGFYKRSMDVILDSKDGLGEFALNALNDINKSAMGIYLRPYLSSDFKGDAVALKTNPGASVIYSNYIERMRHLIKEGRIFVMFDSGGIYNMSMLATILSVSKMYYGQHKPVILFGQSWSTKLQMLNEELGSQTDIISHVTTPDALFAEIEKIKQTHQVSKDVVVEKVVDRRVEGDERDFIVS